ncbi:UTP--glucose-1-phosphate uridylyltransferase [Aureliella helgolandensis]|uniref:Putative uridylyltransferase n=1 Tax=Aureliella helgolandensis TaxID=2527968 RepID=A0A518G073_9BACT|nr:UDPGP type 1 family protein [Aureliella helgolandensis]QDV21940.1 putative uridylyltransferase [Aureliella helgolandensis]
MSIKETLQQHRQAHLVNFLEQLAGPSRAALENQLEQIDFGQLARLTAGADTHTDWSALAARAEPPTAVRLGTPHPEFSPSAAQEAGEAALRDGKVGMILVAGGQGTRLGFDQPKGMFPIGPVSGRTLFQMHCDRLLACMQKYGVPIHLFIMTSPATDAETRDYFAQHNNCGLEADELHIFCQGTMPAVDGQSGQILMAEPDKIALSPDGHGGLVEALEKNGCLKEAQRVGIEHFYYAQVDNPLAQVCAPELLGYHLLAGSEMTTQVVTKRFAEEKVGNVVQVDGKVQIIEYSDLPAAAAQQIQPDGSLRLWAGNIAIHVLSREFLEQVVQSDSGLPFHRAHKTVGHVTLEGKCVAPKQPNAIKFERFVFDLLPLASGAIVVEGLAADVFAPVKNANGAEVDTPATSQTAILAQHRKWLESAGAVVEDGIRVEIHPSWAQDAKEVAAKLPPNTIFTADTFLR